MKNYIYLILLSLLLFKFPKLFSRQLSAETIVINAPEILQEAKKISHEGVVKAGEDDYVYLKVSDDYVKKIYPLLLSKLTKGEKKCLHADDSKIGAHITLLKSEDHVKINNFHGNKINYLFEISEFVKVKFTKKLRGGSPILLDYTWYVVRINSPSIQKFLISMDPMYYIRRGNKVKLHISIAVSKKFAKTGQCYNLEN